MIAKTLIDHWLYQFNNSDVGYLGRLLNLSVPRMIFLEKYKSIPPMTEEERKHTLSMVDEVRPDSETKEDDAKIIFTLAMLNNE